MSGTAGRVMAVFLVVLGVLRGQAAGRDWPVYLGDSGATHYSELRQIHRANVRRLEVAWEYHAGGADARNRSQIQCNPLIVDGVLYGISPTLRLFALDAASGVERWSFDPFGGEAGGGPQGVSRGLVLWQEKGERRLLFTAGPFLHAIDPDSGLPFTSFGAGGRVDLREGLDRDATGLHVAGSSPGAVYRDLLIVSTRVGEGPGPSAPGHIRAYDVRTGQRRWIFHTIPHPGEPGSETWPPDAWQRVGGANCWAGLSVDPDLGLAYVPTGSAAFDFWGGDRLGRNLYANSLLALEASTGNLRWHFQLVRHDLWDRDPPAPPVLCTVRRGGRKVPAAAQITKSGHVWLFHRETGEPLFPWRDVPVPASDIPGEVAWTNQPVPLRPAPFARQRFTVDEVTGRTPAARDAVMQRLAEVRPHQPFQPPSREGTIVFPGFDGGGEWGGAAVDPDGILYVNGNEMPWILTLIPVSGDPGVASGGPETLYTQMCAVCHGVDRRGNPAQNVPPLTGIRGRLDADAIVALLGTGKGVMPSFEFLRPAEKAALAGYLLGEQPAGTRPGEASGTAPTAARVPFTTTGYNRWLDPDGYPAVKPPWGTLNAIDLNSGEFRWTVPLGEFPELTAQGVPPTGTENYGGPVVTAGDLVFIGATKDERFRAFDRRNGRLLWETPLPAGGYATPATYEAGGRQFVVIACGGGKMGTRSGDRYVAFALPR